jgi:ABC-type uncharacterized transport system permease subunit
VLCARIKGQLSLSLFFLPAFSLLFSLLSWRTFGALLLGRHQFGWRGRRAVRVLYTGSAFLLLAYAGSRFVIEVVLGRNL